MVDKISENCISQKKLPNNCCVIDGKVVLISKVYEDGSVEGSRLKPRLSIYNEPVSSLILLIGFYYLTLEKIIGVPHNKCICIPTDKEYYVVPYA